jgi:hypothetical protein
LTLLFSTLYSDYSEREVKKNSDSKKVPRDFNSATFPFVKYVIIRAGTNRR